MKYVRVDYIAKPLVKYMPKPNSVWIFINLKNKENATKDVSSNKKTLNKGFEK